MSVPRPFRRHLLGLQDLSAEEITRILDTAARFRGKDGKPRPAPVLPGKVVANLFFEPSTRTNASFTLAARHLGASTLSLGGSSTSIVKGETLRDTARNIESMGVDILVVRHHAAGAPHQLARVLKTSVVNAGDGSHEHPTQALLDLFTIRARKGRIEGLTVAIVGDILHSRVARSNIWGLKRLGARVVVVGPTTLVPPQIASMGVEICHDIDRILEECDVVNILRIQLERQTRNLFPSLREYARFFGMNAERARRLKKGAIVLHPGPINRGVEITPEVADGPHSVILDQVTHGILIRMASLALVAGWIPEGEPRDREGERSASGP